MCLIHKQLKKIMFEGVEIAFFFCFKQLSVNMKQKLLYQLIDGKRLLSIVVVELSFSVDKLLDFHDTIFSV